VAVAVAAAIKATVTAVAPTVTAYVRSALLVRVAVHVVAVAAVVAAAAAVNAAAAQPAKAARGNNRKAVRREGFLGGRPGGAHETRVSVSATASLLEPPDLVPIFPPSRLPVRSRSFSFSTFVTVASERGVADKSGHQNDERAE
jgi:hypothetical protein